MAELIRNREITPQELVDAHLERIGQVDPVLRAFVMTFPSEARAEARRAGWEPNSGPLHGVPVTVKDSFDVRNYPTLCGSRTRLRHTAERDATAVARLRAAGAIILGKTNCPEFLLNYETDNDITGWTANPWNIEYSAGGSSGGEAAAIASFCSPGGIGSDGGGSIRIPAHFCGIAGLKPTPGRISAAGHVPEISHPGGLLGVGGPMARNAADLQLLFRVLAGHDFADPFSAPVPLRAPQLGELRIGVAEQFAGVPVQPCMKEAVLRAARLLRDLRFETEEFRFDGFDDAPELWWFFFTEIFAPITRDLVEEAGESTHWTGREFVDQVPDDQSISGRTVVEKLGQRDAMRTQLLQRMQQTPVLLLPACGVTAFRFREREWPVNGARIGLRDAMAPATFCNLFGLPAVVIPFGLSEEGLPVGIQIVGQPWAEELILEVARLLEEARGPVPLPPALSAE